MTKNVALTRQVFDAFYEGFTLDPKTKALKIINENAARKAHKFARDLFVAKMKDQWTLRESQEGSLADLAQEINFEEMNADKSSVGDQADTSDVTEGVDLKKILGAKDFDLSSIFENFQMGDSSPSPVMDAKGDDDQTDDSDVQDGDEDFDDLQLGVDDSDMGGDPESDIDSNPDMIGGDEGQQDDPFADDDQQDDGMGGQGDGFDFDFDDLSGDEGDQIGGDQMSDDGDQIGGDQMSDDDGMSMHHGSQDDDSDDLVRTESVGRRAKLASMPMKKK